MKPSFGPLAPQSLSRLWAFRLWTVLRQNANPRPAVTIPHF
jgi:hypothetical protein